MSFYQWKNCTFTTKDKKVNFNIKHLELDHRFFCAFVGSNGSGKTLFANAISNNLILKTGSIPDNLNTAIISFEKQMKLIEEDFDRRNTDVEADLDGYTPNELFTNVTNDNDKILALCDKLNFSYSLNRPLHLLSSGEGRKTLIIEALLQEPDLIVFDSPFDGLDVKTREELQLLLEDVYKNGTNIIVIVNRFDEIPKLSTSLGLIMDKELVKFGNKDEILNDSLVHQLTHYEHLPHICTLPKVPSDLETNIDRNCAIVEMKNVNVIYDGHKVINNLTWTINAYEHWLIAGPNGCGKSTLLSLITGDNPQGYSNDLYLFGIKRGSGETIWDIKKNIGYVSPSFHLDYRVNTSIINVILSGYFDSIGLYEQPGDHKINLALQWLDIIGLKEIANKSFKSLSFGQQRLVLIIRALVKQPPLLILDEPLQGLDALSRELVKRFVEFMMNNGDTQVLFVSHHLDDCPRGMNNKLIFHDKGERHFEIEVSKYSSSNQ